jgi:hypothetical protein
MRPNMLLLSLIVAAVALPACAHARPPRSAPAIPAQARALADAVSVWVVPLTFVSAVDVVAKLREIFDIAPAARVGGEARIIRFAADERTNRLIVIANERDYLRVRGLLRSD